MRSSALGCFPAAWYPWSVLSTVHIQNYGCIRDLELRLGKLTALVGPNSSGKSTLLRALAPGLVATSSLSWRHEAVAISVDGTTNDGLEWGATVRPGETSQWHLLRHQLVRFDVDCLRSENTVSAATSLEVDGANLPNVFGTLTRKEQGAVAAQLKELVPVFDDVDVFPTRAGKHEVCFKDRWATDLWYRPSEASEGTILMLAYLLLPYQKPAPQLLCIEEPDRGLHPYLMEQVMRLLRRMADGELGREPVQIVLATHSADLLDHLAPEEVRFLSRDPKDGGVTVEQVDPAAPDWKAAYAEYKQSLGDVWLAGGLGGVP
jgi:predicted ATPase